MSFKVRLLGCPECNKQIATFPNLPCVYLFDDGTRVPLRWAFGWCRTCEAIERVERLPEEDSLNAEESTLQHLKHTRPEALDFDDHERLEDIPRYRRLLGIRQSGNRCLTCGCTDVDAWSFDDDGAVLASPHGPCKGLFQPIEDPDEVRLSLVDEVEAYSPEGKHIGRLTDDTDDRLFKYLANKRR